MKGSTTMESCGASVGAGAFEAVIKMTAACTDPYWRASVGDERVVCFVVPFSPKR